MYGLPFVICVPSYYHIDAHRAMYCMSVHGTVRHLWCFHIPRVCKPPEDRMRLLFI